MRYGLQPHVTRIRSPRIRITSASDVAEVYQAFETEYSRIYSPAATYLAGGVEILGFTLWAAIRSHKLALPVLAPATRGVEEAGKGRRPAFWGPERGWIDTPVYDLSLLGPGHRLDGPVLLEGRDATVVVDPERWFRIDDRGNGVIERKDLGAQGVPETKE
jgi:N-methylhydantoinase A/oxoprolinase/acetone carboxylase beta subunit